MSRTPCSVGLLLPVTQTRAVLTGIQRGVGLGSLVAPGRGGSEGKKWSCLLEIAVPFPGEPLDLRASVPSWWPETLPLYAESK